MKITISQGTASDTKYGRYAPWLAAAGRGVECVDLAALSPEDALKALETADGVLFTGGLDIDPVRYGCGEDVSLCTSINKDRDAREFGWFTVARERGIPVLGICRGMQLLNVALGGTLCPDVPSAFPDALAHRDSDTSDARHSVAVEPGSFLEAVTGLPGGDINSSHHQSVRDPAPGLRVSARAPDGIAEAIEWSDPAGKPFFLGVQWHPERMEPEAPFSLGIARAFLDAVEDRQR